MTAPMERGAAFVAGATGYTGREVVRALRDRDVETVAHVRPDSPRLSEWRQRFEGWGARVDDTPWEPAALARTLGGLHPAQIFALLGTTRARGKRAAKEGRGRETYETVDYGLTAMLLAAAAALEPRPRFVYLSAVGVSESTRNDYMRARARLEAELRRSGLPHTIVRPSFITGSDREGRAGERAAAAVTDVLVTMVGAVGARRARDRFKSMTGAELAEAMVRAALDPACDGRILEGDDLRGLGC